MTVQSKPPPASPFRLDHPAAAVGRTLVFAPSAAGASVELYRKLGLGTREVQLLKHGPDQGPETINPLPPTKKD